MRRAYHIEHKSIRQIAKEEGASRRTVRGAITEPPFQSQPLVHSRKAPVFGPFQSRVEQLLDRNEHLPRKQRYTSHKIFEILRSEGYQGCESRIRQFIGEWNRAHHPIEVFIPLDFEPGQDAQVDWGEAVAIIADIRQTIQVFVMHLCYSRKTFVMAFPTQRQESFFYGHVQAFKHFGGVPYRISYDNLSTAVKLIWDNKRRTRTENPTFVAFRSHYLFDSHFCTPAQGHEKGGVEQTVGFARRNFLVPIPEVHNFEELNGYLLTQCKKDDQRRVSGQCATIQQTWEYERPFLRPLPIFDYDCCRVTTAHLTPYSQATFETNRYSVPVSRARREVTVKAYPFYIDLLDQGELLAHHPRCYQREQDIFDPLHYLPLLEQRPGAFDYAKPLKQWRKDWPASYHQMLHLLREKWPEGRGVQEFVRILQLHQNYPVPLVQQAIEQALSYGCIHWEGVLHCLHQISQPGPASQGLDLSHRPDLDAIGNQPVDLSCYEQLLKPSW